MEGSERPVIHALIAFDLLPWALVIKRRPVTLEEAAHFRDLGWHVLIDPADEEALTHWEAAQRAMTPKAKRKWFEA